MSNYIDLTKKFPFQERIGDTLLKGNGELSVGFNFNSSANVYTITPGQANEINSSISNLLKILPNNSKLQFQDIFNVEKYNSDLSFDDNFIMRENFKHYAGRKYLNHQKNMYFTLSPHSHIAKLPLLSSFTTNREWLLKKPYDKSKAAVEKLNTFSRHILSSFNNLPGYELSKMNGDEFCCRLHDYFDASYHRPSMPGDSLAISPIRSYNGELKIGNQFVKVITMIKEGDMLFSVKPNKTLAKDNYSDDFDYNENINLPSSTLYPIGLGLLFDHIVNTTIEVYDNQDMTSYINMMAKSHNFGRVLGNIDAKNLQQQAVEQLHEAAGKNQRFCLTSVNVIINDPSLEVLNQKAEMVKTAFQNIDQAECWVENEDTGNLFWSCAPGVADTNYRSFVSTNTKSAYYFHKESTFKDDEKGYYFNERHCGKPVRIDYTGDKYTDYHHIGVFAPTGAGKSYKIQSWVNQALSLGEHVIIIDKQNSSSRTVKVNKGKKYDAKAIWETGLNPFICPKDQDDNFLYFDKETATEDIQPIDFIFSTIKTIWVHGEKIKPKEATILRETITGYYRKVNSEKLHPSLTGYYNYIPEFQKLFTDDVYKSFPFDELMLQLKEYAVGEKKSLLNAKESFDIINDTLVVFEVGGLSGIDLDIVNLNISNLALQKFSQLPKSIRKLLLIDEAVDFLTGDIGSKIGGFFRKSRKLGGIIGVITQSIKFLLNAEPLVRDSIIDNMGIKVLLGIASERAQIKATQDIFGLSDDDVVLIQSLQRTKSYREFFVKIGSHPFVFRHEVSPVAHAVFTTTPSDITEMEKLEKDNHGDIEIAAKMFAQYKMAI